MPRDYVTNFRGDVSLTPNGNRRIKEEPISPDYNDFGDHNKLDFFENGFASMRKSLSMNDIAMLKQEFSNLNFEDDEDGVCERYKKTGENQELSKTKFVSMAEAIYHYERDTPGRFHTTKPKLFQPQQVMSRSRLTIAQSPMLRCKARARPRHIMSQKEKEEMELEEIRKIKIKANPVPKSVIIGPVNLPDVPRKPITVPEPFKLTEFHKKDTQSSEQTHHFIARPAPKHILEKPQIPIKPMTHITKPVSPKFHYKRANSSDCLKHENKQCDLLVKPKNQQDKSEKMVMRHGPIKPEPFSFEKRDEELKRRREERIKRQLEEARKMASQFKAQPLPAAVKKRMHATTGSGSTASSENKENHVKFEAKPPMVLYKEPFKPVLQANPISKPVPFELTTEKRAAERERFEKQIKEKEKEMERNKQLKDQEQREAEKKAIAQLRSTLVHHPKPIPPLIPFVPEKSEEPLTVPETPKFVRRLKQK